MATINNDPRPAYMYDDATDTWYQIAGKVSTTSDYGWTGEHSFANTVTMEQAVTATKLFNVFDTPAARSSAIPNPGIGLLTFLKQNEFSQVVNRLEYWNGSTWVAIADANTVTLSGTQTLTNKTLTSATLGGTTTNSGTISGGTINATTLQQGGVQAVTTTGTQTLTNKTLGSGSGAPFTVSSTTVVTNLNADLLDGNQASAFATSGHTHSYIPTGTFSYGTVVVTSSAGLGFYWYGAGGANVVMMDGDGSASGGTFIYHQGGLLSQLFVPKKADGSIHGGAYRFNYIGW